MQVTFTLTLTKICLRPQYTSPILLNILDQILYSLVAYEFYLFFTSIDNCLSSLRSSGLDNLTLILNSHNIFFVQSAYIKTITLFLYLLNQQLGFVRNLYKE